MPLSYIKQSFLLEVVLNEEEVLLNEKEAAEFLTIKYITLSTWRRKGKGPPFVMVGTCVRYLKSTLLKWIKEREYDE